MDLVYTKSRSAAHHGIITDAVTGAGKRMTTSTYNAQDTTGASVASFVSNGYTLTDNSTINGNSETNVSWNFKGAGSTTSNTNGTITSTVSANPTAGFSIVTWTGVGDVGSRTVGHGLNSAPEWIIIKNTGAGNNWAVGTNYTHTTLPWKYKMKLNGSDARAESGAYFADTAPTSSVFTVEGNADVNDSGRTIVAYCFAPVKGYSAAGYYQGNGNSNGAFVYTGFRPRFLLVKKRASGNWILFDSKRDPFNNMYHRLEANSSGSEYTGADYWNFFSNGFKAVNSDTDWNENGEQFVYLAIGQSMVGTNDIPNNAF